MHLKELKSKNPADLVSMAEELGVEGASTLRKQDLMFAILKELAEDGEQIMGLGTIEVLPDSFGFYVLRKPIIWLDLTIFMFLLTWCDNSVYGLAIRLKVRSAHPRMVNDILL